MNWTPTGSAQLLILGVFIFASYAIVRGMVISYRRKKEQGR